MSTIAQPLLGYRDRQRTLSYATSRPPCASLDTPQGLWQLDFIAYPDRAAFGYPRANTTATL